MKIWFFLQCAIDYKIMFWTFFFFLVYHLFLGLWTKDVHLSLLLRTHRLTYRYEISISIYLYIYIHAHICICMYMYTCIYIHAHAHMLTIKRSIIVSGVCVCAHKSTFTCTHAFICVCRYVYTYVIHHMCIHIIDPSLVWWRWPGCFSKATIRFPSGQQERLGLPLP